MKRRSKIPPLHELEWTRWAASDAGRQASHWARHYPHRSVFLWRMEENGSITYDISFYTFRLRSTEYKTWRRLDPITAQAIIHYINENLLLEEVTDEAQK